MDQKQQQQKQQPQPLTQINTGTRFTSECAMSFTRLAQSLVPSVENVSVDGPIVQIPYWVHNTTSAPDALSKPLITDTHANGLKSLLRIGRIHYLPTHMDLRS